MKTRVRRWGNSLALRLPRHCTAEACVAEGAEVDVTVRCGEIVVAPVRRRTWTLEELVAGIKASNRHGEEDAGPSRGGEAW